MKILEKENCCGCGACQNICPKNAISMVLENDGFRYPHIDEEKCINCGLCKNVCPVLNLKKEDENLPDTYACYNKNEKIRMESSSGGMFSLIAEEVLNQNGVIFGAAFDENLEVKHIKIEIKEDLRLLMGSKYLQSDTDKTFREAKEFLEKGKKVFYTGTPCQIEGLKSFLRKDYENLLCGDLICHGVPSKNIFDKYIKNIGEKIKKVYFRDKENKGWNNYQVLIQTENKKIYEDHEKDEFMNEFLSDRYLRESCYNCKFKKKHRISDFTFADFWGINNIAPEMNDEKGTSLLFVNSNKGKEIFEKLKPFIVYKKVDFYQAIKYNPSMIKSSQKN